jgi:hypothetical protein
VKGCMGVGGGNLRCNGSVLLGGEGALCLLACLLACVRACVLVCLVGSRIE